MVGLGNKYIGATSRLTIACGLSAAMEIIDGILYNVRNTILDSQPKPNQIGIFYSL